jgi:hypothetical protein
MSTAKTLPEPVALRVALDDLIDAMEYHIEQTRPIELSTVALAAARIALAQPAAPAYVPLSDDEIDGAEIDARITFMRDLNSRTPADAFARAIESLVVARVRSA